MQPFSIIIPTYKEVHNLQNLLSHLAKACQECTEFEVILVDDQSQDGSIELMQQLQTHFPLARMLTHTGQRSLSRSILLGCENAAHQTIVCMDADLSHPANAIPAMVQLLQSQQAEMVIGSRYTAGGSIEANWPFSRKFISKMGALATKLLLRLSVHDPLSGFFAIQKSTLARGHLTNLSGWKIALEIMVKCRCQPIREIPIHFSDRRHGNSKLNSRVVFTLFKQLTQLAYFQLSGEA